MDKRYKLSGDLGRFIALGLARWTVWPFVRHTLIFVLGEIVESLKKQEKEDE
jgi:hypothetical protein